MTADEARIRVAKGATWLDRKRLGWAKQINTGQLNLEGSCLCILGQIFGCFYSVVPEEVSVVPLVPPDERLSPSGAAALGFRHTGARGLGLSEEEQKAARAEYHVLQDAWIEAIADRLHPVTEDPAPLAACAEPGVHA